MKLTTTLAIAISSIALAGSLIAATPPAAPANPANVQMNQAQADKCAKLIADAMRKDAKQDAQGQKELDKIWLKYFGPTVPAPRYEGSTRDMMQDAKLNEKLAAKLMKMGCPPVSPII